MIKLAIVAAFTIACATPPRLSSEHQAVTGSVVKHFRFDSDAMGMTEYLHDAATFAFTSSDTASGSGGSVEFGCNSGARVDDWSFAAARQLDTSTTWETWGVPTDTTVTDYQLTAWHTREAVVDGPLELDAWIDVVTPYDLNEASPGVPAYVVGFDDVDSTSGGVYFQADLTAGGWISQDPGTVGHSAHGSPSGAEVSFAIGFDCWNATAAMRFDDIDLTISYE